MAELMTFTAVLILFAFLIFLMSRPSKEQIDYQTASQINNISFNESSRAENISFLQSLYLRYKVAKLRSNLMVFFALISLFVGLTVFFYAPIVASTDIQQYESELRDRNYEIVRQIFRDKEADSRPNTPIDTLLQQASELNGNLNDTSTVQRTARQADSIVKRIQAAADRKYKAAIEDSTESRVARRLSNEENYRSGTLYSIVTTASIRIIIAISTFYLCQLFLQFYKFHLRVSNFYINRYEAILAFKQDEFKLGFQELVTIFEYTSDVGNFPKSPVSGIVDIISKVKDK